MPRAKADELAHQTAQIVGRLVAPDIGPEEGLRSIIGLFDPPAGRRAESASFWQLLALAPRAAEAWLISLHAPAGHQSVELAAANGHAVSVTEDGDDRILRFGAGGALRVHPFGPGLKLVHGLVIANGRELRSNASR